MTTRIVSLFVLLTAVGSSFGQPYYVSTSGRDADAGTLEKPFASLHRAQLAARKRPGTVFVRGGTYYLAEPLIFTAQDSGTKDAPVIFQAYNNGRPVISGGVKLNILIGNHGGVASFKRRCPMICGRRKFS
jgi:hypothetical protein